MEFYFAKLGQTDYVSKNNLEKQWKDHCFKIDGTLLRGTFARDHFIQQLQAEHDWLQIKNRRCREYDFRKDKDYHNEDTMYVGLTGVGLFTIYKVNQIKA